MFASSPAGAATDPIRSRSGASPYPSLSALARDLGGVGRAQAGGRARTGVGIHDSVMAWGQRKPVPTSSSWITRRNVETNLIQVGVSFHWEGNHLFLSQISRE